MVAKRFKRGDHVSWNSDAGRVRGEIVEAIWVAAEMRAGAAFAHSVIALEAMAEAAPR